MIEILVVLVIVAVLLTMAMALTRGVSAAQKRAMTATRIAAIDSALVQFVMRNRRLPCPADGTVATGMPLSGIEAPPGGAPCTGNQVNGVVPWVTLGLPEAEAADGWDRRLTYRVGPAPAPLNSLAAANAMDMSQCDPAGEGGPTAGLCTPACVSTGLGTCTRPDLFLANKGFLIRNITLAVQMEPAAGTGAAYVVVSHGESGGGAYLNSGQPSTSNTTDGTQEAVNYASLVMQAYYVDDSVSDVPGTGTHFDDIVSRPTVLAVITKAALGPRSH